MKRLCKIKIHWIISFFGIVLLIPFGVYTKKFGHLPISNNPEDWNSFFTFYIPLIGLFATLFLTLWVNKLNINISKTPLKFEVYKEFISNYVRFKKMVYEEGVKDIAVADEISEFILNFDNHYAKIIEIKSNQTESIINEINTQFVNSMNNDPNSIITIFRKLDDYKEIIMECI